MNETRSPRSSPQPSATSSSGRLHVPMDVHCTAPAGNTGSAGPYTPESSDNQTIMQSTQGSDGDACGKVWEIYAKEAEQYDKNLVQSWKEDMDNILVFSGLYSAILTAFIIESYKNLQEDPTQTSAIILGHIASQLALSADARDATFPEVSFEGPTNSALACNILWFISLILALFCAFLATLVQQWARQFLQKMGMARSSIRRARLFQFLYSGVKGYRMHAVVDTIPSLLHLSLFTFFGGLVAFLNPINQILTRLVAAALLVVIVAYSTFTLLPLFPNRLNSPFRTPLSTVLWALRRDIKWSSGHAAKAFKQIWEAFKNSVNGWASPVTRWVTQSSGPTGDPEAPVSLENTDTPVNPGEHHSSFNHIHPRQSPTTEIDNLPNNQENEDGNTKERLSLTRAMLDFPRTSNIPVDKQAKLIAWTLKSMNDDRELLPFVEGLLDLLWGPKGLRKGNCSIIKDILETTDPDCDIIGRTISLMSNASNSSLDNTQREHCRVACPRLLHALAFALLPENHQRRFTLPQKTPGGGSRRISWFSAADISTIVESMKTPNFIDRASAGSALALCLLLICQDIEDTISDTNFKKIPQQKIKEYLVTPTFQSLLNFEVEVWLNSPVHVISENNGSIAYTSKSGESFKDQTAKNIELLRASAYIHYVESVLTSEFPYNHSFTISKLESKPIGDHAELCAYLLRKYVESPPTSRTQSVLSVNHLDDIFKSAFDSIDSRQYPLYHTPDTFLGATSIAVYIAWRAKKFGWTTTAGIWRDSERRWPILWSCIMKIPGSIGHPNFDMRKRPCPDDIYMSTLAISHDLWSEAYREVLLCLALRNGLHQEKYVFEEEKERINPANDGEPIRPPIQGEEQHISHVDDEYQLLLRVQESLQPHEATLSPPLLSLKYLADFIAISACRYYSPCSRIIIRPRILGDSICHIAQEFLHSHYVPVL